MNDSANATRLSVTRVRTIWHEVVSVSGAALIVLACSVSSEPAAQIAGRPEVKPGDSWSFVVYYEVPVTEPNRHWAIHSVSAHLVEGTENGAPLVLSPDLNIIDSPTTSFSNSMALTFPLEVGKRWSYRTDWVFKPKGSRGSTNFDVSVAGLETVTVQAGRFDAFRIIAKGTLHGMSPINSHYAGEITTTYWYAPSARAIVKSVHHSPYLGSSTTELVEFRPSH